MNGLYHYVVFRLTNYEALLPYDAMIVRCYVPLPACYCPKNVTFVEAGEKKQSKEKTLQTARLPSIPTSFLHLELLRVR